MSDARQMADSYGRAFFLLTEEEGLSDSAREDVLALGKIINENKDYLKLLDTPALSSEERVGLVDSALGGLNRYLCNLVKLLAEKREAYLLPKVLDAFQREYDLSRGIERVDAITAVPMTDEQIAALGKKLSTLTGKTIIIRNTTDPTILGGVKLRYMGVQLDGSLKSRLTALEKSLRSAVV